VEHYRALQDETLDAAQTAVEDIIEAARDPELVLKAVDRLGRTSSAGPGSTASTRP
jgi:hypothetical protein